jgi:hypothetical protein
MDTKKEGPVKNGFVSFAGTEETALRTANRWLALTRYKIIAIHSIISKEHLNWTTGMRTIHPPLTDVCQLFLEYDEKQTGPENKEIRACLVHSEQEVQQLQKENTVINVETFLEGPSHKFSTSCGAPFALCFTPKSRVWYLQDKMSAKPWPMCCQLPMTYSITYYSMWITIQTTKKATGGFQCSKCNLTHPATEDLFSYELPASTLLS